MMSSEPAKIGVFVCQCGKNVGGVVDTEKVADSVKDHPEVVFSKVHPHLCSYEGVSALQDAIKESGANRLVVAACTPKMHEKTFKDAATAAGMNPYCVDIANIREQCSWVHLEENGKATEKAERLVAGAVKRASVIEPLETQEVDITQTAMVIGGGVAGIQAALDI
ncbi:MAG: CoB--CoM heterodisulfide reductase iron-sulfur subunit A family protein, partial [Thermoplasmata archaeon]|nr:CoB--CoM heterodisulfide reductase iron-sulfur subunit A family protein [Thermoplasmata archaeon]